MLLALQGQRGDDPNDLKFITATVRVDFDKVADGHWRVAQPHRTEEAADEGGGQ